MWEVIFDFASREPLVFFAILFLLILFYILLKVLFSLCSMFDCSLIGTTATLSVVTFLCLTVFVLFIDISIFSNAHDEKIKYIHDISEKYGNDAEIRECADRIVFHDDVILAYSAEDYARCVETILKKRAAREIREKLQ